MNKDYCDGGFTLPGESGYESLTLRLAKKWGADVIRDSDGTKLSPSIMEAGYRIYSTICIIREHNAFAEKHPDAQQQTFLSSEPVLAEGNTLVIEPLKGYFTQQFQLNDSSEAIEYWQVWDRTANTLIPSRDWTYKNGKITLCNAVPWHRYTASFLCWRIWEEINMYNHTTNHWESEHLRQLDPRHPLAWEYLQQWLEDWCTANPQTNVVRLTSLFYNFVWIFGDDVRRSTRFVDWASYDFTVSPAALKAFEKEYGYALTAEDFINKGLLQATHRPPTLHKRDYMNFIQKFVAEKAKVLVDIIHRHGKQAYVFYDDSWVGLEPSGKFFASVGFDGLIKCVFSGFECRLCADAKVPVHELRFHPYLFPVGLGGLPTFSEGGHPERDAMQYWLHVRRALLRQCVDRIGLGGYLHLTQDYPAFEDVIERMAGDFRRIRALHMAGEPATLPITVAVLHTWGSLRPWTLSGHFHETDWNVLIHINEALSGMPVNVRFINFQDVMEDGLKDVDVVINAGNAGDAWSGGEIWNCAELVAKLTGFVHEGGVFIGVGEPSACAGGDTFFRMAHVLGVDADDGRYACHMPWNAEHMPADFGPKLRLTDPGTRALDAEGIELNGTIHTFGSGKGVYLKNFAYSAQTSNALFKLMVRLTCTDTGNMPYSLDPQVEIAWFPASRTMVLLNNADDMLETDVQFGDHQMIVQLKPYEIKFVEI